MRFVLRGMAVAIAAVVCVCPPAVAQSDPPKAKPADPEARKKKEEQARQQMADFLAEFAKGDDEAAMKRLTKFTYPFTSADGLRSYREDLTRWHGKLKGVAETKGATLGFGTVGVSRVTFERGEYVVSARLADDGTLTDPAFKPLPLDGAGVVRVGHGCVVGPREETKGPQMTARGVGVVSFAVPGTYRDQVPLAFEVKAEPAKAMKGYKLRLREDGLNWVCDVAVNAGGGEVMVWWEAAVLVADRKPAALPKATAPEVTAATERWTRATGCVQSDDPGVVKRAEELAKGTADVGEYAKKVTEWVANNQGTGKPFYTLDAAAAIGCGGSCTSRANLAAALLRARGIPARTVAHLPRWAGPHYVHWLTEYWHPGHGWVTIEPSNNQIQPDPSTYVVLNVANPDDEEHAEFASLRSGVMAGAPRLSSRDIDGGIVPLMNYKGIRFDTRVLGLAVPLAKVTATDAEWRALTAAATAAHAKLAVEGKAGGIKPERTSAVWGVLADKGVTAKKLTEALVPLAK